ncbi:MAG: flavodoxin-dependent (E)-4-hydroxy-3-methylbut-2-enyl-diphosphate synthase [Hyphomonas sp.]
MRRCTLASPRREAFAPARSNPPSAWAHCSGPGSGDTIRVSLSADPVEEVKVGFEMLKSLGLRTRGVNIVACPSCARQGFDVIRTVEILEQRLAHIHEPISLSIIGCVVNGPGEAALTDLGFTGGGKESGKMFVSGRADHNVSNADMIEHIVDLVEKKAEAMRAARDAADVAAE